MNQKDTSKGPVGFFARHLVSLGWTDRSTGQRAAANAGYGHHGNASGFVISVKGFWFLMTAGHVLREIEDAQQAGQELFDWHLDDTGAAGTKSDVPIPFDFDQAFKLWFHDGSGADYALIGLRPYYRMQLTANNIVALDETAWKKDVPTEFDKYLLIGVPDEFVGPGSDYGSMQKGEALIDVERLQDPPAGMVSEMPRFYGKLPDDFSGSRPLNDIAGMSGGPIFGLKFPAGERMRYWLVALQSSWLPKKRIIAACPIPVFAAWIEEQIESAAQEPSLAEAHAR